MKRLVAALVILAACGKNGPTEWKPRNITGTWIFTWADTSAVNPWQASPETAYVAQQGNDLFFSDSANGRFVYGRGTVKGDSIYFFTPVVCGGAPGDEGGIIVNDRAMHGGEYDRDPDGCTLNVYKHGVMWTAVKK